MHGALAQRGPANSQSTSAPHLLDEEVAHDVSVVGRVGQVHLVVGHQLALARQAGRKQRQLLPDGGVVAARVRRAAVHHVHQQPAATDVCYAENDSVS